MAHLVVTNSPIVGIDMDSEDYALGPEDARDVLNIRNTFTYTNVEKTATNVKGNLLVSYNLGNIKHKCIGSKTDKANNSIIYCLWAANGEHKILRWWPEKIDATHPYGTIELVMQFNFGWSQDTSIHSSDVVGDMFYWVDPVPKKINLVKANLNNKFKTWKVILPHNYEVPLSFFQLVIKNYYTNASIAVQNITTNAGDTIEEALADIADQINTGYLADFITAKACNCSILITEKVVNAYDLVISIPDYFIIPENFYGKNPIERYFDAAKYPSLYQPNLSYEKDPNTEFNFVAKTVFQARTQYLFDDYEESVLSPISQINIDNITCDGTADESFNFIRVNINDPELLDLKTWVLVKKVNILIREHNSGEWKIVATLEPCDFLNVIDGDPVCYYDFYNNTDTYPVSDTLVAAQYDFIPRTANTQSMVGENLTYAGIEDNFNVPDCIKASCNVDFIDNPLTKLYRVRIYTRIYTVGLSDAEQDGTNLSYNELYPGYYKSPFWLPSDPDSAQAVIRGGIFHDTSRTENNFPFFGGGGFGTGAGFDFGIRAGMEDKYDQRLPEGGFVIYIAGKPVYGITRQINIGLPVDSMGALDTSSDSYKNGIGEKLGTEGVDLYSVVDLYLPPGEYVARVASHWCSNGDKLGFGKSYDLNAGLGYQKTSTNVWGVFEPGGSPYNPGSWKEQKEIRFTVSNADIDDAGTFVIMDLAPTWDVNTSGENMDYWQPINGYLYDSLGASDPNSEDWAGVPVEKAVVIYEQGAGWNSAQFTDHNGYFFGIHGNYSPLTFYNNCNFQALSVGGNVVDATQSFNIGTIQNLLDKNLQTIELNGLYVLPSPWVDEGLICGILTTNVSTAREDSSTVIEGDVIDQDGNPVPNAEVVYTSGQVTTSNNNGHYDFIAWGDMVTPNVPVDPEGGTVVDDDNRIVDSLIFGLPPFCNPTFPDGYSIDNLPVDPFGDAGYNPTNHFVAADFEIDHGFDSTKKYHKRGGRYIYVVRFADKQTRLSNCVQGFEIYIPFITEDLNKYLPEQYPVPGTYKYGAPTLTWNIDSAERPPIEAASFQWLRSRNLIYGDELQWAINSVTYLSKVKTINDDEQTTSYSNFDAVAVKLSLSNILDYFASHPESHIAYEFQPGDRIRFIADRTLVNYNGLIEAEILSYDSDTQSIIVKVDNFNFEILSGSLVELYQPHKLINKDGLTFVEVGEAYPCTAPGDPSNDYSVKTGVFTNGDTYWRGRYIPVNDDKSNFSAAYPVLIEANDISDFFLSKDEDMGRIGAITDSLRKIFRGYAIRLSNQYIPDTGINGLCTFRNIQDKVIPLECGPIQRTVMAGYVLLVVALNRCVTVYVGRSLIKTGDNDYLQANTDTVLGDTRTLKGEMGTQHPESVAEFDGYVYGVDAMRGVCWRYASDGLNPISNQHKMRSFFNKYKINGVWSIQSVVDRLYEEYIITVFEKLSIAGNAIDGEIILLAEAPISVGDQVQIVYTDQDTGEKITEFTTVTVVYLNIITVSTPINGQVLVYYKGEGRTLAWSEPKNRFTTRYSYLPERMEICDKLMVSFKNGAMWIHDKNPIYNNFYGVQYTSQLLVIPNGRQQEVKVWLSLMINSKQDNKGFDWSAPQIYNKRGQSSYLLKSFFAGGLIEAEEYWHTDFKRDVNTVGVTDPIFNGAVLRHSTLTILLENDYTGEFDLRAINCDVEFSKRNVS